MPGKLQPLVNNQKIVKEDGTPTDYFIRWAQQRQIDIAGGVPGSREVIAGTALNGGGALAEDITINHDDSLVTPGTYGDATHVPQFVVDEQGHVQGVVEVPISGGGGGGNWWFAPPVAVNFPTLVTGTASNPTVTDDADIGMTLAWIGAPGNNDNGQGCYTALPAAVDWDLEVHFSHQCYAENYRYGGLSVGNVANNKTYTFALAGFTGGPPYLFNLGQTANVGQAVNTNLWWGSVGPIFLKLTWVNATTTLTVYASVDGKNWILIASLGTGFLGAAPDIVGFKVHASSPGGHADNQAVSVDRWVQSW